MYFVVTYAFFGVNFILQKFCLCKKNDKYEVWNELRKSMWKCWKVVGNTVLWTPCCGGWAHRSCVERMALVAGSHHFKCPLCNNKDEFTKEMEEFGIYVPDQDAEWEAGDAFGDQLQRHDRFPFQ